jgi:kynurenine 3-monooxygenase
MTEKVTLVGGGLAGSLMSIYLAKRGYDVYIYERRGDMRSGNYIGGRSINLALSTRGLRGLAKVGLDQDVLDISIPMTGRMMHSVDGALKYQPYGKDGQAIYSVSRGQLNIKLLQLADQYPNIHMFFNCKCVSTNLETCETTYVNERGETIVDKADVVLGTDGAFSALRDAMQRTSRFNFSQTYENYGYKELEIVPNANGDFQLDKNSLHIWPRQSFMMIALPNPGGNFTCTLFMPFDGNPGIDQLTTPEEITAFFQLHFPDAMSMMPGLVDDYMNNPTGVLATMRCYPWVRGNNALMGDSAHAVVPFYGQGMNCSFEDCVVLDECIEELGGEWGSVLDAYQKLRKPNADAIANLALQNFVEMRDLVGSDAFLHKKKVEHMLSEKHPDLFVSQYERVTFSTRDYAEALAYGELNDRVLESIIQNKWEEKLDDRAFVETLFADHQ